jgi:replicative DNA helicase
MQQPEIIPPHSVDLEESLLSSLFDDTENVNEVSRILKPEHFYTTKHRHVYQAFVQLTRDGEAPEGMLLAEELRRSGKLDEVGGPVALVKLKHEVPPAGDVRAYAEKIRDLAIKRSII